MSSWKKARKINQKTHRGRHQPESRKCLGILEKKKDYQLRARDVHLKKETMKLLHKRTLDKNPNEFYHHMIRSKIEDSEHREFNQPDEHTKDQLAIMQTQDLKYVLMKRTMELKKIQTLQSKLHMIGVTNETKNKHVFFTGNAEVKNFDLAEKLETHPSLIQRKTNRLKSEDLENLKINSFGAEILKQMSKNRENSYKVLKRRIDRAKELAVIQQKMELKRVLQQKRLLKPKRIESGTKNSAPVYEFKYERKR